MNQSWRFKILSLFTCFILTVPQIVNAAEETPKEMWETMLMNWLPMLLLIGIWIYVMRYMKPAKWQPWGREEITQLLKHLENIEQSLERIARALEKK